MANEAGIRDAFAVLLAVAVKAAKKEVPAETELRSVIEFGFGIVEEFCVDVHRAADALEVIAGTRPLGKPISS